MYRFFLFPGQRLRRHTSRSARVYAYRYWRIWNWNKLFLVIRQRRSYIAAANGLIDHLLCERVTTEQRTRISELNSHFRVYIPRDATSRIPISDVSIMHLCTIHESAMQYGSSYIEHREYRNVRSYAFCTMHLTTAGTVLLYNRCNSLRFFSVSSHSASFGTITHLEQEIRISLHRNVMQRNKATLRCEDRLESP